MRESTDIMWQQGDGFHQAGQLRCVNRILIARDGQIHLIHSALFDTGSFMDEEIIVNSCHIKPQERISKEEMTQIALEG